MLSGRVALVLLLCATPLPAALGAPPTTLAEGAGHERWQHPAGMISRETVAAMREKCARYAWARKVRDDLFSGVKPWLEVPMDRLRELTPRRRTNVYHNFSCPDDRSQLKFDPFNDRVFTCPRCGKTYSPDADPKVYPPGDVYRGTVHDGWGCLFFMTVADAAFRLGLASTLTEEPRYARRAAEILLWFAALMPKLPRERAGGSPVVFTYNREGDNGMLLNFATAYELIRGTGVLTAEEQHRIEQDLIRPFCDDVIRDPEYRADHNNISQWLLTVMQVGVALEDRDYLEYAFGLGAYGPEQKPRHRSLGYVAQHHFLPDGAFWELCSGYHLYPLVPFCRGVLVGRNLARQEPARFPPGQFDATDPRHPTGNVARRALRWYLALALPDYTTSELGDSMRAIDSLKLYDPLAEIAYREFGIDEAAYYPEMGTSRGIWGLVYGAGEIVQRPVPFRSARLSSGFVALRGESAGDRLYAGINFLLPGGGHQHADRLELITYARDRLLGRTKGVPYNDPAILAIGKQSFSHNTVTVDKKSQKKGDRLQGEEIPRIRYFQSNPEVQFAEVWGDHIYPQTQRYRRAVALIDDVIVDIFDVAGGAVHDWIYHCDGEGPQLSLPTEVGRGFDPPDYVLGGAPDFERARARDTWSAVWTVPAEPHSPDHGHRRAVHHRLTMLGEPETEVFHLKTYPVMKRVAVLEGVTNTVVARRTGSDAPFVSVLETYTDRPVARSIQSLPCDVPGAAALRLTTSGGTRLLLYNPDPARALTVTADRLPVRLGGHFAVIRLAAAGMVAGAVLVDGSRLEYGGSTFRSATTANLCLTRPAHKPFSATTAADLAYETLEGMPIYAACEEVRVAVTTQGKEREYAVRGKASGSRERR